MADTDITIKDAASVDRKVDTRTVGAGTDEYRQVVVVGDPNTAAAVAKVANADAAGADYGQVVRPAPQEVHLGAIGGNSTVITVTPTVSTTPNYSSGDAVGGKQTLTGALRVSGGTAVLQSVTIIDKGVKGARLSILVFDSDPSAATITDNSEFVFSTAVSKLIARIAVTTSDWVTVKATGIAVLRNLGLVLLASGSADLYVALVADAQFNAFASTTDLTLKYGLIRD